MTSLPQGGFFTQGFIIQSVGLLVAIFGVGQLYSQYIRPQAAEVEITRRILENRGAEESEESQRNFVVILKDYEQQACLTLMVWATILLSYKLWLVGRERQVIGREFVELEIGQRILPEAALDYSKEVQTVMENERGLSQKLLPGFVLSALQRFNTTHSIQDVQEYCRIKIVDLMKVPARDDADGTFV